MDNTIIEFPQKGLRNGNKVAKLSTAKRDQLVYRYKTTILEKEKDIPKSVTSTSDDEKDINALDNIDILSFDKKSVNNGTRKLKINEIILEKSKSFYNKNRVDEEKKYNENVRNSLEEEQETSLNDTRISRLERTSELSRLDINNDNIINTPDRFMKKEEERASMYDSLINEPSIPTRESIHTEDKIQETSMGGDPNLYTKLVHGNGENSSDEMSIKLQEAISKLGVANEEKEKAKAVNASLAAEVENVRETLARIRKEKEAQEQKVLENTLNMLKAAKEEILDETRKYDNLQEELASLIKERDALLKSPFVNQNDDYSAKKTA